MIGNDASWMQIAREQVEVLGTTLGTDLRRTDYHKVAEGYGGVGLVLTDPTRVDATLAEAKAIARGGRPVCINVHFRLGKREFESYFQVVAKLLALVLLAGCAAAMPPAATAMDADRVHVQLADLQKGRDLLVSKCGASCHATPLPAQHPRGAWPQKLGEMSERAGLVPAERTLIEQYLTAMSR